MLCISGTCRQQENAIQNEVLFAGEEGEQAYNMKRVGLPGHFNKVQWMVLLFLAAVSLFLFGNGQPYRQELTEELNPAYLGFLQPGDYTLEITVEHSPGGNVLCICSDEMIAEDNSLGILLQEQELKEGSGIIRVPLSLEEPTYGVYVRTACDREDKGYLARVDIQSNRLIYKDNYALGMIVAAAGILLAILFWRSAQNPEEKAKPVWQRKYSYGLLLTGMGLLASMPLFSEALLWGDDTAFNLVRLEGIYRGMASGFFPVRITPQQMAGYGTLTSSMYPQLFLYPAAMLRFFGVSLLLCYKILLTAINIATAFSAYYGAKNVCGSSRAGLWTSILYTFSIYRLSNMYVRGALGETLAMVFLPLVIWGVYEVLWGKRRWIVLALGITGVLESHLLSAELCVLFMTAELVFWLFSGKKNQFGKRFLDGCRAVGVTVLLNAGFLVPFLFFCGEDFQCFDMPFEVSEHAAYFSQMFTFFPSVDGASLRPGTTQYEMPLSVGGILLAGVLLFLLTAERAEGNRKRDRAGFRCVVYGAAALIMASWLFPWERIGQVDFLRNLFTPLQFSWRFLGPATVFWSLAAALGIVNLAGDMPEKRDRQAVSVQDGRGTGTEEASSNKYDGFIDRLGRPGWGWLYGAAAVLVLVSTTYFFDSLAYNRYQRWDKMTIEGLSDADGMYLYRDSEVFRAIQLDYHRWDAVMKTKEGTQFTCSAYRKEGSRIYAEVTPAGDGEDILMFPLYWFPGYEIRVNGEKADVFACDTLVACKMPRVPSVIEVNYAGMWFFRLGDTAALVTFCVILIRGFRGLRRKRDR